MKIQANEMFPFSSGPLLSMFSTPLTPKGNFYVVYHTYSKSIEKWGINFVVWFFNFCELSCGTYQQYHLNI